jgi:hypothetical protein
MAYEEQLQYFILRHGLRQPLLNFHLLVFDIEKDDRRKIFHDYVAKAGWRKFQDAIHETGDDSYEYVLCEGGTFTPKQLYELLKVHNRKILIFDNDTVINKKGLLEIIEGGICSSPDSCSKWPVRLDGKPEFIFEGIVIILTGYSRDDFKKKEKKFHYLIRDCVFA